LRIGIIDYLRNYTLDKFVEEKVKEGIYGEQPTIVNPEQY